MLHRRMAIHLEYECAIRGSERYFVNGVTSAKQITLTVAATPIAPLNTAAYANPRYLRTNTYFACCWTTDDQLLTSRCRLLPPPWCNTVAARVNHVCQLR